MKPVKYFFSVMTVFILSSCGYPAQDNEFHFQASDKYELRYVDEKMSKNSHLDQNGDYWENDIKATASQCRIGEEWIKPLLDLAANIDIGKFSPIEEKTIIWTTLIRNTTNQDYVLFGKNQSGDSAIKINGEQRRYFEGPLDHYLRYAYAVCQEKLENN